MLKPYRFLLALLILNSAMLSAHDMWIEPTAYLPETGRIVGVKLRVGDGFLGDPVPHNAALIDEFVSVDSTGRKPVVGRPGSDPAGLVRVAAPGMLIIGYKSNPAPVALPAAKFNQYLREEGLESILELRALRNQTGSDAREIFSRCAKSLVFSGAPAASETDRVLGFPLELVTLKNPYALRGGEDLPVTLTYEGKPLSGALVVAMNRADPKAKITARTDKAGRVSFKLAQAGQWLIKAVHMVPAPASANAEWASFWASLTFESR